jgi:hypothetical protein
MQVVDPNQDFVEWRPGVLTRMLHFRAGRRHSDSIEGRDVLAHVLKKS